MCSLIQSDCSFVSDGALAAFFGTYQRFPHFEHWYGHAYVFALAIVSARPAAPSTRDAGLLHFGHGRVGMDLILRLRGALPSATPGHGELVTHGGRFRWVTRRHEPDKPTRA